MPAVIREYDVGQLIWFVDTRDNSLHEGEIVSATVHAYASLNETVTKVAYKIHGEDDYYDVLQEHVGATTEEAVIILNGLLDSYEC